jgi:HEPN domain-containing protein
MNDLNNPSTWVDLAEEDYLTAQSALRRRKPLVHSSCFHAQQCAEKYLKALLVSRGRTFPRVHDLLLLSTLSEQSGILLPIEASQLHTLTDFSVRVRYPGETPTVEDAREALSIAKSVRKHARSQLGIR